MFSCGCGLLNRTPEQKNTFPEEIQEHVAVPQNFIDEIINHAYKYTFQFKASK